MNSGADLSGTNGKLLKVTEDDMKIHSELNNVWIILNGATFIKTYILCNELIRC